MRLTVFAAIAFAMVAAGLIVTPTDASAGWGHHRYNAHSHADPYAYRYEPRGYYPYYGSRYWRPHREVRNRRFRFKQPRYYKAWGAYSKKHWHKLHNGRRYRKHHY